MLILGRRPDTGVTIDVGDQQIHILVMDITGNQVRLGFTAGPMVRILRDEVYDAIQEEQAQSP